MGVSGLVGPVALLLLLALSLWALYRLLSPPLRAPRALAVDDPDRGGMPTLSSGRYRLSGKPDELRRTKGGRLVPVEIKSARPPRGGVPYPSHRVQLLAYCLLLEDSTGAPPPYGILVYGDGTEISVPWDGEARTELLSVLRERRLPYHGATDPSLGKCRSCPFERVCDGAASLGLN